MIKLNILGVNFLVTIFIFFILIVLRYIGPHHNLFYAIEFIINKNFIDDLHITNSIILNSGAYYKIFRIFLANDYLGLIIHIIFSFVAIYYLYKILKNLSNLSKTEILIILTGFITLDHFIMPYVRTATAFIGQHHSSSIGLYLIFPCIYYSLNSKIFKYSVFMFLSLIISPKLALFSNLILSIYLIVYSKKIRLINTIPLSVLFFTTLYFVFLNNETENFLNHNERLSAIELLFLRGSEDSIDKQRNIFQITLLFSLILYLYLTFTNKANIKHKFFYLSLIIFIFSFLLIIFSYFYTYYFYKVLPAPKLVMLSPVRNLILFQIFLFILISLTILKSNINNLSKGMYFASIIYWNVSYKVAIPFNNWYLPSIGFLSLAIIIQLFYSNFLIINNILSKIKINIILYLSIIFLLPIAYILLVDRLSVLSVNSINKIGRFYSDISNHVDLENYAYQLRSCDNFTMQVFVKNKKLYTHTLSANHIALKSTYYLDYYTMNDLETMRLAISRDKIIEKLLEILNNSHKLDVQSINKIMENENVLLVIKDEEIKLINYLKNKSCKYIDIS